MSKPKAVCPKEPPAEIHTHVEVLLLSFFFFRSMNMRYEKVSV